MKFCLQSGSTLTPTILKKILEKNKPELANYKKLADYYSGKHDILNRKVVDKSKPNNKIVNPYPQYIVDTLVGYWMGEGITYSSNDETVADAISALNTANSTVAVDMDIAKTMGVFGESYELHYINAEGQPRFKKQNPENMIVVVDDSIEENIIYGIRLIPQYDIEHDKTTYRIEVYDDSTITYYTSDADLKSLNYEGDEPHYFGAVPIVHYQNNEEELGDFETIIPLIDAYDTLESDALNDFNYFVDCYLVLKGMTADSDDIAAMKEERVILLDEDGEASWLIKSENDTVSENIKDRFKNDIHKFSKVPDLSDENFSNNSSGVAMKYKLFGTETVAAVKEMYMRKGLRRRIMLLFNILNLTGSAVDYNAVEFSFNRNIPTNETEVADVVNKLYHIVSDETLLAQIPFVTDVKEELEALQEQNAQQPIYDLDFERGVTNG